MMNHGNFPRLPAGAILAAITILATGAGLVSAFQEPPGVSSQPISANNITPPASLITTPVPGVTPVPTVTPVPGVLIPLAIERPDDIAAIRTLTALFVKAYNAHDAAATASLFTENARIIDEENTISDGRAAIMARFARRFAEHPGETIVIAPETIRFLGLDTAIEEGTAAIRMPAVAGTPQEVETTRYTVVYVKRNGGWLHASVRDHVTGLTTDSIATTNSNYGNLRHLDWLVGDWVEEGSDVAMDSSFAWSENRNYLIRTFSIKVPGYPILTGTQRIGWDPSTRQIRSWEFDSDGSFGEGIWSRRGDDQWIVKMTGVRHDGRTASDTRVIFRSGVDHLTWQAIDRTLGGEVLDDTAKFSMVRRAPSPGEAKVKRVTQ